VAFIDEVKARFGVEPVCRVLSEHGVQAAPSTYYAHKVRPASPRSMRDEELKVEIERVWAAKDKGRELAGARKVWHLLRREGIDVARCTVERLMRELGLRGVTRGPLRVRTTMGGQDTGLRPPDLCERNFTAAGPNRLWLVDFTYVPTWSGTKFTAFVSDAYSRRIVGWRTAASMPTQLPLDALEMALWVRAGAGQDVAGVIHHSDAGSQYTAIKYQARLLDAGAVASIGTVADSYDNAQAETLIGLYKVECVRHDGPIRGLDDLELATCNWVHWYNTHRLHGSLGYVPPIEYENEYYRQINDQSITHELQLV
jgi:putative transposase